MGIDTVKLRSPTIGEGLAQYLHNLSIQKVGTDLFTGEVLYEIFNGELEGSWDSRISFKVCRKDWVSISGRVEQVECDPYILIEVSLHKLFYGQNVYGQIESFQARCEDFIDLLGVLFGLKEEHFGHPQEALPSANRWQVRRVDWAEVYQLTPAAIAEFFRGISHCRFPRRSAKSAKYGVNSVHFPGSFTTLRLYHKGPEFKAHEVSRLRRALRIYHQRQNGELLKSCNWAIALPNAGNYNHKVERKLKALQRLADNRLRVEVQINAEKLQYDFNHFPLVSEITDDYLRKVHDDEVFKLLREGKAEMETVRTHDQVKARLNKTYGNRSANVLYAFWVQMATRGEETAQHEYSRSQFYSNRKKLVDAGVAWMASDVVIVANETALPRDFVPLRISPRLCRLPVSNASVFNQCPVEWGQLKAAA